MASSATPGSKRSDCSRSPVIARASALARARPSGSSSPRWATVCWMTLRPTRTERTRRQYRWTLPSFRSVVWRRYITQLIGHVAPRSQRPWLALHHGCSSRRSMATTDTHGATWRSRRALAQTAEVGLAGGRGRRSGRGRAADHARRDQEDQLALLDHLRPRAEQGPQDRDVLQERHAPLVGRAPIANQSPQNERLIVQQHDRGVQLALDDPARIGGRLGGAHVVDFLFDIERDGPALADPGGDRQDDADVPVLDRLRADDRRGERVARRYGAAERYLLTGH